MKKKLGVFIFLVMITLLKPAVFSHCEVPCGIYDDEMRFTMVEEHIKTIEKAMNPLGHQQGKTCRRNSAYYKPVFSDTTSEAG